MAYSNSSPLVKTNALLGQIDALWTKEGIENLSKAELLEFGALGSVSRFQGVENPFFKFLLIFFFFEI